MTWMDSLKRIIGGDDTAAIAAGSGVTGGSESGGAAEHGVNSSAKIGTTASGCRSSDMARVKISAAQDDSIGAGSPPTKQEMIDTTCFYTCMSVCYGVKGQAGICCTIGERDYIIGPMTDPDRFLKDLREKLGEPVKYKDVFIDYEEGSKMFPDKPMWQQKKNYPAMRVLPDADLGYPCQFWSKEKLCMVHSIKPEVCRTYLCDYLQKTVDFLEETL